MFRTFVIGVALFLYACGSAQTVAAIAGQLASNNAAAVTTVEMAADPHIAASACGNTELCTRPYEDPDKLSVYARWSNGADLDLLLTLPSGELAQEMDGQTSVTRSRGDCGADLQREETFSIASNAMPAGPYVLEMRHTAACDADESAEVEVLVRFHGNTVGHYNFPLAPGQLQIVGTLSAQ